MGTPLESGPIDAAIKAALGGASAAPVVTNFEGTVSQGPTVTVETSGTLSGEGVSGQFSGVSSSQESSSSFTSSTFGEWSDWQTVSTGSTQSVPRPVVQTVQTAPAT